MLVVEKCKDKKEKLHYTFEQISEISGIPLSTVYSFFKESSQNPGYITVGAICKCLGVSLDAIIGIEDSEMSDAELARVREESKKNEKQLREAIQEHAQNIMVQEETIAGKDETIRRQDLRMELLNDRVNYQKKAITWLRFLSVAMCVYSMLTTILMLFIVAKI